MASIDPKHADKRTVERYIKLGLVDEKEYEKHLKSLPDLAGNALKVEEVLDDDIDDPEDDPQP
jgi:hypothetical protein